MGYMVMKVLFPFLCFCFVFYNPIIFLFELNLKKKDVSDKELNKIKNDFLEKYKCKPQFLFYF